MAIDPKAADKLSKGWYKERLSSQDCKYLLEFTDHSSEANLAVSLANRLHHQACNGTGQISAEIETVIGPCPGNCGFCKHAEGRSMESFWEIDDGSLAKIAEGLGLFSDVRSIRLTTCAYADIDTVCRQVGIVRDNAKCGTRIYVNTRDLGPDDCRQLKAAGAYGAVHAPRLGEGKDTEIPLETRLDTMTNLVKSGLEVITGVEPIGPEHSIEDIVDNFFLTLNMGCASCELVPREPIPGTKFNQFGKLGQSRFNQIRAVLTLGSSWYTAPHRVPYAGAYVTGGNVVVPKCNLSNYKERIEASRRRLFNGGYDRILKVDDSTSELNMMYLRKTGSV